MFIKIGLSLKSVFNIFKSIRTRLEYVFDGVDDYWDGVEKYQITVVDTDIVFDGVDDYWDGENEYCIY